ncbi:GAF domain-containing protein [Blastococcus brunescens]|uniref:GAF domain-containing protein n=1 Tax=Blastococcus brunescens TaxID=1564165 RepID=A0ABZ1B5D7_9ACTN|nr:GAF domain-containing protein [Blastococcus sp. BMG 8361]WRL64921.1 GAF domain-containing protein [Blastococcus sp. BMG 8361]
MALSEAWTRRSEKRRTAQAEVLLGLIESAATAQSMDHLLGSACRQLAELGEVERACIFLLEDGRLVPRMAAYADGRRDLATWEQFRNAPVGLNLAETVLRIGEPITADKDSGLLSGWWVDSFHIASGLAVPIGRRPDLAGVLTLDSTRVRPSPRTSAGWRPRPARTSAASSNRPGPARRGRPPWRPRGSYGRCWSTGRE